LQYSYIARQPILNRQKSLAGYELLFRDGPDNCFPNVDAEHATSRLVSDQFLSIHRDVPSTQLAFVNFPYQSLINMVPTLLPKEQLVIEILENCQPTKRLLHAIKQMVEQGYKVALDDFIPNRSWMPFLPFITYIKFDIRNVSIAQAQRFMQRIKTDHIQYIAEKVETYDEFKQALDANFTLFQGYFFSKPEVISHKKLTPSFLTMVQLSKEISARTVNYDAIEALISSDVSLSYKLLTLVNSSYRLQSKIKSFKQAIVYLGEHKIRKFISLLAVASCDQDKPLYLYGLSIQTARFCELIAAKSKLDIAPGTAFLTGMFCYLDSILDRPLPEILDGMPIEQCVKEALTSETGELGLLLKLAKGYEQANWQLIYQLELLLKLGTNDVAFCYHEAIKWTAELFDYVDLRSSNP
jgi:EAL and modified HD-GYP domain-containing signal transduction protein